MSNWKEVSKSNPCPLCQKPDWCSVAENGKAVLCRRTDVAPIGWNLIKKSTDGFPVFAVDEKKAIRPKQSRSWTYCNRSGSPLVRVWRVDDGNGGKPARWQERWTGKCWAKGLEDVQRHDIPVYRYEEVQNAIANNQPIFIVEGEPCADVLWGLGLAATTNIGGAGKWTASDTADLAGAKVILCPDRDEPGLKHMEDIFKNFPDAQWLFAFPDSLGWTNPPKSQGVDVADWIADYKLTADDVKKAVSFLPAPKKDSLPRGGTDELLKEINSLIDKDLPESDLQRELIRLSKREFQPLKELWTLHNALAQERDRNSALKDSLPQLERLIQYEAKKDVDWEKILPSPLVKALKTKADADRIELIYLIQSLMPALAGLMGAQTGIVCKEGETEADHWIEYPIIWTTIVAQPSAGKSNADRAIFNPILKMQETEADRYERGKEELEYLEKQWERRSKADKEEFYDTLENPANFKESLGTCRKFFLDEGEIEAVKRRISEQSPGVGVTWNSDELLSIFKGLDQYKNGRGNGRQFLLKAWNSPLTGYVDRVNEAESFRFKGQCLNLCGGIQIGPAAQFFNPDGQNLDEDGLRSRVLVAIPQLHKEFDKWNDSKVNLNFLLTDLYQRVQKVPKGLVHLSTEATNRWRRQWEKYRKGLKVNSSSNPAFAYFLGKMCSNLMRLALVLHTVEHCYTPKFDFFTLDLATLEKAIKMADFYVTQFRLAQSMFAQSPENGMSEFLLNILNLCLKEGSLAPYQVVDRYRRHKGKQGKPIRAAEVKEMFAVIAETRPQQVSFDGKKLFALEKTRSCFSENTYKTRSGDRANKPLQDEGLSKKHVQHVHFPEEKNVIFDDFSSTDRSCLYGKSPQTLATPSENGTITRSCPDRVLENPIVFSDAPIDTGEPVELTHNQGSPTAAQGFEGANGSIDATQEPDRVSEKPDRVSEKPDRVSEKPDRVSSEKPDRVSEKPDRVSSEKPDRVSSEKPDRVSEELQLGKLVEICADIPSLEPLNGKQGVIDLVGSGVCRLQFADGGFNYVPHRCLTVIGEGLVSEEIQELIFSDKITTKSGKRRGTVSKVRRFKNDIRKYEITWNDTDEVVTYSLEEMQMAGFMRIENVFPQTGPKKPDRVLREIDRVLDIGVGDWVQYKRSAPEGALKATCSKHRLEVLEVRGSEALVKRETWSEGYWIAIKHLERMESASQPVLDEDLEDISEIALKHISEGDEEDNSDDK